MPLPPNDGASPASRLLELVDLFPRDGLAPPAMEIVPPERLPEPYRRLLAHDQHMTVTLEGHHGRPVVLRVLARRQDGDAYARKLILTAGEAGPVVLAGIMRIRLHHLRPEVRERIVSEATPLGRILIEHDVLRSIEPEAYFSIRLGAELRALFQAPPEPTITYGRLARIICDDEPAVELLEIVAP